jgi:hypothetical protein
VPDKYPLPSGDPASLGFAATPLQHLDRLIRQHIEEGRYPGAQIALARNGKLALFRTYGDAKTDPRKVLPDQPVEMLKRRRCEPEAGGIARWQRVFVRHGFLLREGRKADAT